ncbi:MAG: HD domain-containing phosphohydrolase [Chloroflexota bacterium]
MIRKTANALNSSDELEGILQAFADLNMVIDPSGVILEYKPGYFLPMDRPEIEPGQKIQAGFSAALTEKFEQVLNVTRQTGRVQAFEYQVMLAGREHWFDARLAPVSEARIIFTARDITKSKETENRMKQHVHQLSVLRSIDLAIASGLDLNLLLAMLLDQLTELMQIDAVAILLQNHQTHLLEFTAGKGFRSTSLQYTHLKIGEGYAGRVALERKLLNVPNLKENQMEFGRSPLFTVEGFVAYYGVPLIAKGRVLGVLEMFQRSLLQPDAEWLNFLNMVAGQAAIAIDSAIMFRELQRSNIELSVAYDATIEGLTRALDLRDKETEEHTRRVADTAVRLAVHLGVGETDLIHIRRGAILHDIGKVAIPDRILLKPGPLAEDEWQVMRRHPGIAVDLLSSIAYLAQALEIPHWHHEKWDGTGYPDHLRGDAIPFAARLFALVDVYDALTSNRPYRTAWSKQETLQYIESQAGQHFDPVIVPKFLTYMNSRAV